MIRKGIDFIVKHGGETLGGQRGASIELSKDLIETTTKDSTGGFREHTPSFKSWSISADGLLVEGDAQWTALIDAYLNDTKLSVEFAYTGGSTDKYTGDVYITSMGVEAPYDAESTYSVEFTGTGAVARATA